MPVYIDIIKCNYITLFHLLSFQFFESFEYIAHRLLIDASTTSANFPHEINRYRLNKYKTDISQYLKHFNLKVKEEAMPTIIISLSCVLQMLVWAKKKTVHLEDIIDLMTRLEAWVRLVSALLDLFLSFLEV